METAARTRHDAARNAEERRLSPRAERSGAARISFQRTYVECGLQNISTTGAKLSCPDAADLPAEIIFEFDGRRRRARVIWRAEGCVGIAFTSEAASEFGRRATPPDPSLASSSGISDLRASLERLRALLSLSGWTHDDAAKEMPAPLSYMDIVSRIGLADAAPTTGFKTE